MPTSPFVQMLGNLTTRSTSGVVSGATRFCGYSYREASPLGGSAVVRFRHGAVDGQILAVCSLREKESETQELGPFDTPNGVYVEVVSGTIEGVVYSG